MPLRGPGSDGSRTTSGFCVAPPKTQAPFGETNRPNTELLSPAEPPTPKVGVILRLPGALPVDDQVITILFHTETGIIVCELSLSSINCLNTDPPQAKTYLNLFEFMNLILLQLSKI